ncbi:MAG: hypothetical protein QW728_02735 [Thermoplasmata archaeon]
MVRAMVRSVRSMTFLPVYDSMNKEDICAENRRRERAGISNRK